MHFFGVIFFRHNISVVVRTAYCHAHGLGYCFVFGFFGLFFNFLHFLVNPRLQLPEVDQCLISCLVKTGSILELFKRASKILQLLCYNPIHSLQRLQYRIPTLNIKYFPILMSYSQQRFTCHNISLTEIISFHSRAVRT